MLSVADLNQYYGGSHILRNVAFDVPAGRVIALLGRNGVGKTTLLRTLMGLLPAATGSVRFGDADLTGAPPYRRVRAGIGYVPQGREIFPRLTVEENLAMGLATRPRGTHIPERIFEMFPVLKEMLRRRGGDLSGGQQQQLAIGRALSFKSRPFRMNRCALRICCSAKTLVYVHTQSKMAAFPSQENRPLKKPRLGYHGPDVYPQDPKQKEVSGQIIHTNLIPLYMKRRFV